MGKALILLAAFFWSASAVGGAVRFDFSRQLKEWTLVPAGLLEAASISNGVRLKVLQVQKNGDGALQKRIALPPDCDRFVLSAEAVGEGGYLQVKLRRGGREIGRYSSDGTASRRIRTLRCEFPADGASDIEICLRMKLQKRYVGRAAEFYNLRLEAAPRDPLEVVPLYCSASYYCNFSGREKTPTGKVEFRRKGNPLWRAAYPPVWCSDDRQLRGSIVDLDEDTEYELRFTPEKGKPLFRQFRTWKSEVPIARTIDLGKMWKNKTVEIAVQGTPDGYVRYTAAEGTVIAGGESGPVLRLRNAAYVILENLTLRGGAPCAVEVENSNHVIFRNCDISGWGIVGEQRFDRDGKFYDKSDKAINYTAGIEIMSSDAVTVERCRIHEPRNRANPWFFSHPAGPQALLVGHVRRMVVRWNDFIGCEYHRWNDAVEGWANFNRDGGFERDCDIYGNLFAFGNDDGIELDGGQMNVRLFDNWIEGTYCGVSTCGCMRGPSYAFRNLVARLGDEMHGASASFKSGRGDGMLHIFNNTLLGGAGVNCTNPELRAVTRNNIIQVNGRVIYERRAMPGNSFDHDLCYSRSTRNPADVLIGSSIGTHMIYRKAEFAAESRADYSVRPGTPGSLAAVEVPNFCTAGRDMGCTPEGANWPPRPGLEFMVDAARLEFPAADAPAQHITLTARRDFSFKIAQSGCLDWFSVTPSSGVLAAGEQLKLMVKPNPERFRLPGTRRGGFAIRQTDGLSRPILVYAKCDRGEKIPEETDPIAIYRQDRHAPFAGGVWKFELKKPQTVYVVVRLGRFASGAATVTLRLDGGKRVIRTRTEEFYNYPMTVAGSPAFLARPESVELDAGFHVLEFISDQPVRFEWAVVTSNPWPLFTRFQH